MMQGMESNSVFAMRVCVCVGFSASDTIMAFLSFHFQQKSVTVVSTVKVSLNVLVDCKALENM